MGEDTFEHELGLVGSLDDAVVERQQVRFPSADARAFAAWLREYGPRLPTNVFSAVTDVATEGDGVVVRFGHGPEPGEQVVAGRNVACHLHGGTARPGGDHVGSAVSGA